MTRRMVHDYGPHSLPRTFPLVILHMRAYHGLTYRELAKRVGMSENQMRQLQEGRSTPTLTTFVAVCQALELSPAAVMASITGEKS